MTEVVVSSAGYRASEQVKVDSAFFTLPTFGSATGVELLVEVVQQLANRQSRVQTPIVARVKLFLDTGHLGHTVASLIATVIPLVCLVSGTLRVVLTLPPWNHEGCGERQNTPILTLVLDGGARNFETGIDVSLCRRARLSSNRPALKIVIN